MLLLLQRLKIVMSKINRRILQGEVLSDKMQRTIVVAIKSRKMHSLYKKYIGTTKKVMAHDSREEAHVGDVVRIVETRPLSRVKRWELLSIVKKVQ